MKELSTKQKNGFTDFMGKMEQVGHMLMNQQTLMKDRRQSLSIPKPFQGFMNGQHLI